MINECSIYSLDEGRKECQKIGVNEGNSNETYRLLFSK